MTRKCKVCKSVFVPFSGTSVVCSPACAIIKAQSDRVKAEKKAKAEKCKSEKAQRKADRAKRQTFKKLSDFKAELQTEFNRWVLARDKGRPCISCGRHHTGQYHAGHFLSVGAHPELRYEPLNVWRQCAPCNTHLSGNVLLYRKALIQEIGLDKVEWLEGPHPLMHYTKDELIALKMEYRAKRKALEACQ